MKNLVYHRLSDFVTHLESGGRPKGGGRAAGDIPSLGAEHLTDTGKFDFEKIKFIPKDYFNNMNKGIIQKDDILIVKDGATTGKVAMVREDFQFRVAAINEHLFIVRINKSRLNPKFLFYFLFSGIGKNQILRGFHGSAQGGITKSFIDNIKIPLFELDTQRKIASILEKAESAREKRKEANRLTDEFLKSAFLEMFGDPVKNTKKFEKLRLEKVCKKIRDGTHYSPKQQENGFPYITAKNIKPWGINLTNVTYISEEQHKSIYKRCDPKKGDVIYIKDGVTAGLAKVNNLDFEFSMLSSIALIRPNKNLINPFYLEYYLNHPHVYKRILERKSGSAITRLILKEIKDIEIHIPPVELQQKFADLVQKVEKLKEKQSESENELNNLFNSLMQKAFRGELV